MAGDGRARSRRPTRTSCPRLDHPDGSRRPPPLRRGRAARRAPGRRRCDRRRRPSARASLEHLADHVPRAPPHLLIDPADVLADQPEGEDLEADEEEQDREQGEHPFDLGAHQEAPPAEEDGEPEAYQGHEDPAGADALDGPQREPGEQVEVDPPWPNKTVSAARRRGISSGGFWRSASSVTTMSPRARSIPANTAACCP